MFYLDVLTIHLSIYRLAGVGGWGGVLRGGLGGCVKMCGEDVREEDVGEGCGWRTWVVRWGGCGWRIWVVWW